MTLIRYPGSKAKLAVQIVAAFPDEMRVELWAHASKWEYREPFFGAGAIGFQVFGIMPAGATVELNDKDYWISSLWNSVLRAPEELVEKIRDFTPSPCAFYEFKEQDGDTGVDPCEAGFRKLALHQMSVSGFGSMSGGPIGGRDQENARYKVGCRWNAERLCRHVLECHQQLGKFRRVRFTCRDFSAVVREAKERSFLYLDPPYVGKGGILYRHAMVESDHRRLAGDLFQSKSSWVLSYDDHPLIRELYEWADITELRVRYSNATLNGKRSRPKNREILIRPGKLRAHGEDGNETLMKTHAPKEAWV
ncbi:hypothetical protein LCGC14_1394020 [marine sediment metagenome]|uniref:Site-specific DNA-methyltransferase (adenine-specific) n=1 Tax=marine sediment metagenome TaxID=412755 RepID=A0A0F9KJY1_9ZZZZ